MNKNDYYPVGKPIGDFTHDYPYVQSACERNGWNAETTITEAIQSVLNEAAEENQEMLDEHSYPSGLVTY